MCFGFIGSGGMQEIVDMPATDTFTLRLFQGGYQIRGRQINEIQISNELLDSSSRPVCVKPHVGVASKRGEHLRKCVCAGKSAFSF